MKHKSSWILAQSVLHLINPSLYLHCPFFPLVLHLWLRIVLLSWWFLVRWQGFRLRLEVSEFLFQLSDLLLNVLLLRHRVWIPNRWFALCIRCSLLIVLTRSLSFLPLKPVHHHTNEFLVVVQRRKIFYWWKILVHLCVFLQVQYTRIKCFMLWE